MAGKSAILSIKILTDATAAQKGMDDAARSTGKFQSGVSKASGVATVALAGLGAAAISAGRAAAEDAQSQALLANSMRNAAGATDAQVAATEDAISKMSLASGIADDQLRPAMATLVRATGDAETSQSALASALDISAATGKDVESVSAALAKGYAGNTSALGKLVPGLDKAVLATGDMDKIMAELARTTGGASAEAADTAAGKMARMQVAMAEAEEAAGAALLPAMEALAEVLGKAATWAQENANTVRILAIVFGGLAAAVLAVNVAMKVAAAASKAWAAAQWLLNAAMSANPVGLIIIAVIALVAAVVLLWKRSETFRDIVLGVWAAIRSAASAVLDWLVGAWQWVQDTATAVWESIRSAAATVVDWLQAAWRLVFAVIGAYLRAWATVFRVVLGAVKAAASVVLGWLRSAWSAVVAFLTRSIQGWQRIAAAVWNGIKTVVSTVVGFVRDKWDGLVAALKRAAATLGGILSKPFDVARAAVDRVLDLVGDLVAAIKRIKLPDIDIPFVGGGRAAPAGVAAAPNLLAAGARAATRATPRANTGGAVVININGAVDPEATARQVRRILSAHDRRMGVGGSGLRAGTV